MLMIFLTNKRFKITGNLTKRITLNASETFCNTRYPFFGLVSSIPDICQFWYTATLLWPLNRDQKVRKFVTKWPKISLSSCKKGHWLEKITPPLMEVVVTIIS